MSQPLIGSVLLASIGAAVALASPASAGTMEPFNSEVRYGDLNLRTEAGVTQLQRRINSAARQACGYADSRDLTASHAVARCRDGNPNADREILRMDQSRAGFDALDDWLARQPEPVRLVTMEASGHFWTPVASHLQRHDIAVAVAGPGHAADVDAAMWWPDYVPYEPIQERERRRATER